MRAVVVGADPGPVRDPEVPDAAPPADQSAAGVGAAGAHARPQVHARGGRGDTVAGADGPHRLLPPREPRETPGSPVKR